MLVGVVWLGASAVAQPNPSRPSQGPPPTLGAGFAALDAGRLDEAASVAAHILREAPGSHGAVLLQILALASGTDPLQALKAYDARRERRRADDPFLLFVIGEGVARRLAVDGPDPALRVAAAELLVSHGVAGARGLLSKAAQSGGPAGAAALARAGDVRAAQRTAGGLGALHGSAKATAVDQLGGIPDPVVVAAVQGLAADPDPMVRASVATALGQAPAADASVETLRRLLADQSGPVRQAAAIALVRTGNAEGEALIEQMLASGVGDLVLAVAEALPEASVRWADRVRPLLEADDPVERLRAARLLKDVAPTEAAAVFRDSLTSDNVALRDEAARLGGGGMPAGAGDWRPLLADPSGWVRLAGARVLMGVAAVPLSSGA